jgi:hypothetical protein
MNGVPGGVGIGRWIGYRAAEGGRIMTDKDREALDWLVRNERDRQHDIAKHAPARPETLHHTELPEDTSGTPAARDWNCYLREAGRLIAEGHEGRWVLIKSAMIVGVWDTEEEARTVAAGQHLMEPILIHQIRECEPVLRAPTFHLRCHS